MNPNRIVRSCLGIAALLACLASCSSSGGDDADQGGEGANWDQLVWDQDDWS